MRSSKVSHCRRVLTSRLPAYSSGYATDTLTYDSNGNLLYDGTQVYTYDAWNRLMTTSHGYRDSSNTLQHGQVFSTASYDASGRRITKAITGTGGTDCGMSKLGHYYLSGQSVIEELGRHPHNLLKQHAKSGSCRLTVVDELLSTRVNSNPVSNTHQTCMGIGDTVYYDLQEANYPNPSHALGIVNASGVLTERYEYTPYGQRVAMPRVSPSSVAFR